MAVLQVLVDENGDVLGTARIEVRGTEEGPDRMSIAAGPGQRVVEMTVDDYMANLEPDALHAAIKAEHLK
jgi:hypothetical protein